MASQTTTAIFTGAGASKAFGYPLTAELLRRVRSEIANGELFTGMNSPRENQHDRAELDTALRALLPGLPQTADDQLPLITDIFSLVDYAIGANEALPAGGDLSLRRFRDLLVQAITDVLLGDLLEAYSDDDIGRMQERLLHRLVDSIEAKRGSVAVVTTNYDIAIEYELYGRIGRESAGDAVDLGFDWRDVYTGEVRLRLTQPDYRIYKLHGSLDLLRCARCGHVYFNPNGAIIRQAFRPTVDDNNTCHCGFAPLHVHIVSPSMVRDVRDANLLGVWRSALEYLRRADEWYLIGYSLPPEDLAIRSLLLRAYTGRREPPRVTVVQKGTAAQPVYELLFPGCRYIDGGLEALPSPLA